MTSVLVVDDEDDFTFAVRHLLSRGGFDVACARSGREAIATLSDPSTDVVLLDLGLPDRSGLDVLSEIRERDPTAAVIVLTGRDDAATAVAALRLGASHYLTKPVKQEVLLEAITEARDRAAICRRIETIARTSCSRRDIVGASPAWRRAVGMIVAAASAPRTPILVTGESGTGKEIVASLLHEAGERAGGPFVAVNAACFPPSLLEGELLGHEAGAFTGAHKARRGCFEMASGGTLFLDEVGEMPLELQPRLLRVLEGHPFRRLGGEREIRIDVRFVFATNRDLAEEVRAGRFRLDLYHRLRVIEVRLPPLREREGDIELLALHFISHLSAEHHRARPLISPRALEALRRYRFPGNVRELRNAIERALLLCRDGEIDLCDLPPEIRTAARETPAGAAPLSEASGGAPAAAIQPLDTVISEHVIRVYRSCGGNLSRAARALGIGRLALRRRLKQVGLRD